MKENHIRKALGCVLALILVWPCAAPAEEDADFSVEEIIEDVDLDRRAHV